MPFFLVFYFFSGGYIKTSCESSGRIIFLPLFELIQPPSLSSSNNLAGKTQIESERSGGRQSARAGTEMKHYPAAALHFFPFFFSGGLAEQQRSAINGKREREREGEKTRSDIKTAAAPRCKVETSQTDRADRRGPRAERGDVLPRPERHLPSLTSDGDTLNLN